MRALMCLLLSGAMARAFQQPSPPPIWDTGLGPILESTFMKDAERHAQTALQLESNQQWGPAGFEYQQVIEDAQAALRSNSADPSRDPTIYYTLGLAQADAA